MVSGTTFEEDMFARITEARTKQRQLQDTIKQSQDTIKQAELELEGWKDYAGTLSRALELGKRLSNVIHSGHSPFNTERLLKQSTWLNLKDMMIVNKGLLVTLEAVDTLVNAKVFGDREHARNVIFSTLYSHKKDVEKIRDGVYRLIDLHDAKNGGLKRKTRIARRQKLNNPMSFEHGVNRVLREAQGEPLGSREIWRRMQIIGIVSNAKDPAAWVDWHARKEGAEKVAPHTWKISVVPINDTSPDIQSSLALLRST